MTSKRVTAYLRHELDSEQVAQFEKDVAENDELAEELARQLLQQKGRLELKAKLGEFEKRRKRSNSFRKRGVWLAAASVIFLAGFFIWQATKSIPHQELYAAYFEAAAPLNITRDSGIDTLRTKGNALEKAMLLYAKGEYSNAKVAFQELESSSKVETAKFYLAMCYLADDNPNYKLAVELLSTVLEFEGLYQQQARWYRGLAYLHLHEIEKAEQDFEKLVGSGGYKSIESEEILRQL